MSKVSISTLIEYLFVESTTVVGSTCTLYCAPCPFKYSEYRTWVEPAIFSDVEFDITMLLTFSLTLILIGRVSKVERL